MPDRVSDRVRRIVTVSTWSAAAVALACGIVACAATKAPVNDTDAPPLSEAHSPGRFQDMEIKEASGLASSSREPGVFWTHNDSGNDERVFAFDTTGHRLGALRVAGARNRDWEAIARGPCDTSSCLYVGDVGDNFARQQGVRLYRIAEPLAADTVSSSAEQITITYPDGARDVESIWVTPDTSVYLLTKRHDQDPSGGYRAVRLYRVPASAWKGTTPVVAEFVDSLPITPTKKDKSTWLTDAAFSDADVRGERRLAVRSYGEVFVFAVTSGTWKPGALLATCSLSGLKESKSGEGVTWLPDGRLLFDAEAQGARLHVGRCP